MGRARLARGLLILAIGALAAGCAGRADPAAESDVFERESPGVAVRPPRALVAGVPFVSWNEAARLWFREKDLANPSSHAAFLMVLGFWGQHWALTEDREAMRRWGTSEARRAAGLDEVKSLVAAGIPVIVPSAMTPVAHPVSAARRGPSAIGGGLPGVLGDLEPISPARRTAAAATGERWEPLLAAFRVLIGYDDDDQMVTLHDPTFGPAWRVPYADFDRMWNFTNRAYVSMRPLKPSDGASRGEPAPYRQRTSDEEAATQFAFAAALAAVGRWSDAAQRLADGLALPGLSAGYEHLLRLELAAHELRRGRLTEAVRQVEQAVALVPEHARAWLLLRSAYAKQGGAENAGKAEAAAQQAQTLSACSELTIDGAPGKARPLPYDAYLPAQRVLANAVARDFFVAVECPGSSTTWLLRPLP